MATYKAMLSGFAALAGQLMGVAPPSVVDQHMPPKVLDPRKHGRVEFRVVSCRCVNKTEDELRETFDVATNKIILTAVGFRVLTIQVKWIGEDHRPSQDALFYLERLGDRMFWPSAQAALHALDMGIVSRGAFLDLSAVASAEDRQASIGVKEFMFNVLVSETATGSPDAATNWIETLTFASNMLNKEDGTPTLQQISGTVVRP